MINDLERSKKIRNEMEQLGITIGGMWEWGDEEIRTTTMGEWDRLCLIAYIGEEFTPIAVFAGAKMMRELAEVQAIIAQKDRLESGSKYDKFKIEIKPRKDLVSVVGEIEISL